MLMDPRGVPYVIANFRYEDESTRLRIHDTYLKVLQDNQLPWELVSGSETERTNCAQNIIETHFIRKERET